LLTLAAGRVRNVKERRSGLQIVEVQMEESGEVELALSFAEETYVPGEVLLLNTTAVRLRLGTGGYHLVLGKVSERRERTVLERKWGHVMKMRYAPWQLAVDAIEEQDSPCHALFQREDLTLEGTPVLIGELHSLLPVAAMRLRNSRPSARIAYVMPDGASLPAAMSRHLHQLRSTEALDAVITTGHAWGGDYEAVTLHSGLLAARHVAKADVILCMLGPGVAGTGTPYAFSGVQLAEVAHAVTALGGLPLFLPRLSFADARLRHYGISHHSLAVLGRFTLCPVIVLMPRLDGAKGELLSRQAKGLQAAGKHHFIWSRLPAEKELAQLELGYGLPFTSMGRGWQEDPVPFLTAVMAADQASLSMQFQAEQISAGWDGSALPDTLAALALFLTRNEAQP